MSDPAATQLAILHLDEALVVVSKPSGMLVHRAENDPGAPVLLQTLKAQVGRWLYPVQRLDRATSGAIAFAFSPDVAAALQRTLTDASCRKDYLALVRGQTAPHFECAAPLADERGIAREAHTVCRTLAAWRPASLVRARIFSGRANQIRRHLADLGHPVLGDGTFGKGRVNQLFRARLGLPRLFLHATRLCFDHPVTGRRLCVRDRLPTELRAVLHSLARREDPRGA